MSQPLSASTSSDNDAKADQIAHRFFNKFALLVSDARATAPVFLPKQRVDKWVSETGCVVEAYLTECSSISRRPRLSSSRTR